MSNFMKIPKAFFTSESVTEGHPDKLCDQISDGVLDAILAQDPIARVACETATTTGLVLVAGDIGKKETAASFDYGARLTEFSLLGNLAQHAGVGKKIEWDGPNMKVTNLSELNQWVKRPYRKGWPA